MPLPRIAVTLGDPAGIGPEIAAQGLARPDIKRLARVAVIGSDAVFRAAREQAGVRLAWQTFTNADKAREALEKSRGLVLYEPAPVICRIPKPGRWTRETGRVSLAWVKTGTEWCLNGWADGLVTGPVSKAAWQTAGAKWPGHTELLAELCGVRDEVMLLAGGGLRVALVTVHEPLARVPSLISRQRIVTVGRVLAQGLAERFSLRNPRIAVLGLNPHAGEGGLLGDEERRHIVPAIRALRRAGIDAIGPLAADTAFHRAIGGEFDVVLAMYHDQGLGPLKTLAFDSGVNVTLGLPIVRVSVDHGTAFDIAGRGVAKANSFCAAFRLATEMAGRRAINRRHRLS
jgi:4-hydroxythreonine-4-phosphate dehydrogenase